MKRLWALLAAMMLFVTPAFALNVGDVAPNFSGTSIDGQEVSLADMKGKVVVLKLATTWCPTCKEQMDELEKAADFMQANDIPLVEVYFQESASTVKKYLTKQSPKAKPIALTDDGDIFGAYNVYLIPRLLVIDKEGNVARDGGLMEANNMLILLEKLQERTY